MKDYYLLIGLNSKEVKIKEINQKNKGLIEIHIENKKQKVRCSCSSGKKYKQCCGK